MRSLLAFCFALSLGWLLSFALGNHVLLERLELAAAQVFCFHNLGLAYFFLKLYKIPNKNVAFVTSGEKLIVSKGQARNAVGVANKFFNALGSCDVPNSNRCVVTAREKPLTFNRSVLLVDHVSCNVQNPTLMTFETFNCTGGKIVGVNNWVHTTNKQPFVVQMKTLYCLTTRNERPVDFPIL